MTDNGYKKYGDFDETGREFIITRQDSPKPWGNHSWNRLIDVLVDQRGRGMSMYRSPEGDRTYLIKDRTVYVKDRETQEHWTAGWDPVRLDFQHYKCAHGLGYSRMEMTYDRVSSEWTVLAAAEAPVELWRVKIKNDSERTRTLSAYPYVEFDLRGFDVYCNMENSILIEMADDAKTIYAINKANERPDAKNSCFMAADPQPKAYQTSKKRFLGGSYGTLDAPAQILADQLASFATANEDLVGVFQYDITLEPGEEFEFDIVIGPFQHREDANELRDQWIGKGLVDRELKKQTARTDCFDRVSFSVPDEYFTKNMNFWAKQQLMYMGDWSRGWSMGFRDTCQDAQAICPYRPEMTRALLIETMEHQHPDGSALRAWFPIDTHKYADSGVWLTFTLCDYIKETGDLDILDEVVPYYDGGEDTVYQHLVKALKWIYAEPGPHGMTKVFFGDWNDALDIGNAGKGESVWLSIALVWAHEKVIELAEKIGDNATAEFFREEQKKLMANIEANAWDGEWYLRGFTDLNEKVGSKECEEGRIFCLPQTWAIMARIADEERVEQLEASLQEHLMHDYGLLVMYPCFKTYRPSFGRITTRPAGWGVNGSSYCHVSGFKAYADTVRGDGDAALDTLSRILPNNPRNPIEVSAVEPYGFTNMYNGPEHPRPGVSLRQWYTGTVAWSLRATAEGILGAKPEFDGLLIEPVLPSSWDSAQIKRCFRDAEYDISIRRGDVQETTLTVDGETLDATLVPYERFKGKHSVEVVVPKA